MPALVALIVVTAVWGVTFVQVKDAVALYPLFAFLAVRFAIASLALAVPAAGRMRSLGRRGWVAGSRLGVLLAVAGLALLTGVGAGDPIGDLLVLGGSAVYSLQIVLLERYAPRFDPIAFTQSEMVSACVGFAVVAVALGQIELPRGWTVWGALLVTGVFASALGYLVQAWAQRRTSATRTALLFALEPVFAGIFGYALAGDRLGWGGWAGGAAILTGIAGAEPA